MKWTKRRRDCLSVPVEHTSLRHSRSLTSERSIDRVWALDWQSMYFKDIFFLGRFVVCVLL